MVQSLKRGGAVIMMRSLSFTACHISSATGVSRTAVQWFKNISYMMIMLNRKGWLVLIRR